MSRLEFETKYLVGRSRVAAVRALLNARCVPDSRYPENLVAGIYFDSLGLEHLHEKLDSNHSKIKVRLRWYESAPGTPGDDQAFLEIKRRIGKRRTKSRVPARLPAATLAGMSLTDPALRDELGALSRHAGLAAARLWPCLLVRYRRLRFVEPLTGSRISLDVDIRTGRVNPLLAATPRRSPLDVAVLEVKNADGRLPIALRPCLQLGCRSASFSKYAACFLATGATERLAS